MRPYSGLTCYPDGDVRLVLWLELCEPVASTTTFLATGKNALGQYVDRVLTAAWWCDTTCSDFYYESWCAAPEVWEDVAYAWRFQIPTSQGNDIRTVSAYYECCDCP